MATPETIAARMRALGEQPTQYSIDELRFALLELPTSEYDAIAPGVWEGVAQLLESPDYEGDAKLPIDA